MMRDKLTLYALVVAACLVVMIAACFSQGPVDTPLATEKPEPTDASDQLSVEISGDRIEVEWQAVEGAIVYEVVVSQFDEDQEFKTDRYHVWYYEPSPVSVDVVDRVVRYEVTVAARGEDAIRALAVMRASGPV